LIAAGTNATTVASAPAAADDELDAVDAAVVELEDDELLLLLLPHPTAPATHASASAATNQLLHVRIKSPPCRPRRPAA
jgi:hypothetical protein